MHSLSNLSNQDIVLIHDAARPFVDINAIAQIIETAHTKGAATLATPVTDTIRECEGALLAKPLDRNTLRATQTPQGFRYSLIKQAHDQLGNDDSFTDDAGMVQAIGQDVAIVEGSKLNFKITTKDDLMLAHALINQAMETRTGQGYDVHAFDEADNPSGTIRLCGIDIPHPKKLKGHSDADVGLHTITDALYGALALGDIGTHFPPSDNSYKNMDSAIFLEHATQQVTEHGGSISHIDLTLICEAPKIGPHAQAMRERVSAIMNLPIHRISIKATTSEKLGFTGREEGIAATAVATLKVPSHDN